MGLVHYKENDLVNQKLLFKKKKKKKLTGIICIIFKTKISKYGFMEKGLYLMYLLNTSSSPEPPSPCLLPPDASSVLFHVLPFLWQPYEIAGKFPSRT